MWFQKRRFTIFPKLLLGFLIAILPVYMLGIYLNKQVASSLRDQILQSMQTNVKFYLSSLTNEIVNIENFKRSLLVDEDLMALSTVAPALTENELREAILRLERKVALLQDSSSYIASATLYIPMIDKQIKSGSYIEGVSIKELETIRFKMQQQLSPLVWHGDKLLMGSYYPESVIKNRAPVFLIEIEINQRMIMDDLSSMSDQGGAYLYFKQEGRVITNHGLPNTSDEIERLLSRQSGGEVESVIFENQGKKYLVSLRQSSGYDFSLGIYTPEDVIMRDFDKYNALFWILFALSIIVMALFSYWIFKAIRNPVRNLLKAFRKVEQGQLAVRVSQRSNDEFSDLSEQFNKMVSKLQSLIQEVYEQQIRSQQSELRQLQSQINPHFLYNSFFILHQLIEFEDLDNARKFVHYLGNYFQFITRDAKSELSLGQEMKHAEAYLNIQMMRFGSRINVSLEPIPSRWEELLVPRLIVQPIIENAYQHGLESRISDGHLRITNELRDNFLCIYFEDNGTALTEDELMRLKFKLQDASELETTGVVNVHRRLQIKFGLSAGLYVFRSELGGLGVAMKIPIKIEEE
ncbi:hypothetical protein BK120_00650 [Paenibacillus sp. FSL A5-0031]|uniref:sensor histidine kinase n=1 Tax=Paenibacillus sp. FSL A5-0031 TaxID=1920420 RepID=UPI00096CD12C|nr:histidine kinase [Paenibacillus sp. FSL A5-0031]OME87875.1 hypothetical protein BK120_00650 [Paenibacillus sp. FSL A5-0031]